MDIAETVPKKVCNCMIKKSSYFVFKTRFASLRKSLRFVPISDKQKTTTSQDSDSRGVLAKSQTVT